MTRSFAAFHDALLRCIPSDQVRTQSVVRTRPTLDHIRPERGSRFESHRRISDLDSVVPRGCSTGRTKPWVPPLRWQRREGVAGPTGCLAGSSCLTNTRKAGEPINSCRTSGSHVNDQLSSPPPFENSTDRRPPVGPPLRTGPTGISALPSSHGGREEAIKILATFYLSNK